MKSVALMLAVLAGVTLEARDARADWEGKMKWALPKGQGPTEINGTVRAKAPKMRIDIEMAGMPISLVLDSEKKKFVSLLHAQKMIKEMSFSEVEKHAPVCLDPRDVEGCLKKQGFKKTGAEKMNGHPADIYSLTRNGGGMVKVWRPTDLKEVPSVRTITTDRAGKTTEINILDIKTTAQAKSHFEVPSDYRAVPDFKSLKKKGP